LRLDSLKRQKKSEDFTKSSLGFLVISTILTLAMMDAPNHGL